MEKRKRTTLICKNKSSMKDHIGQLSDDVLGIIISHLTLKEAGRSSVLSHRWKNLWKLSPHLNFDASEPMKQIAKYPGSTGLETKKNVVESERRKYIRWVGQVVENHQGSNVDELVVVFDLDVGRSFHLDKWISFAMRKRVKVIKIDLSRRFFCGYSGRYSFTRNALSFSGIESLTSLCLTHVDISEEMVEHLLLVCPLLERLCLELSNELLNLRVVGSSLKLKYLKIDLCSLKSIEIYAPNLMSFHYRKLFGTKTKLQVGGLRCLVDLHISVCRLKYEYRQLSSYFFKLETLALNFSFCKGFQDLLGFPKFSNLKHLKFKIIEFDEIYLCGLAEFINLCPSLHKFTLEFFEANKKEIKVKWGKLSPHHSLKVVEMIGFIGQQHEIKIAKCFLKSAIKLEKLVIDTCCDFLAVGENKMLRNAVAPGSRERAEQLRRRVPPGVELHIL